MKFSTLLSLAVTGACSAAFSATPSQYMFSQNPADTLPDVRLQAVQVNAYKTVDLAGSSFAVRRTVNSGPRIPASIGGATALVPNFYMPEYGSKLSSTIYIRGVGSRLNDPAVGMYVDNVPILDRGMYNFDLWELSRVEVLRGPQGALWGRNSMGGMVSLHTPSPLSDAGTKFKASFGSANSLDASLMHHGRLGEKAGLSAGASVRRTDGFFTNIHSPGAPNADESMAVSARARLDWRISRRWTGEFSASAERSDQRGYPYGAVDSPGRVGKVNYNSPAGYLRRWLLGSAHLRYSDGGFSLSSTTSFQHFDDRMTLDQDFTPADLFAMTQRQNQNGLTQEFVLKGRQDTRYRWLLGAFGFHKHLTTRAPVDLKREFFASVLPELPPPMYIGATGDCLTDGYYRTPSWGAAAFHHSELRMGEFTLSAGLRFDYERVFIEHNTSGAVPLRVVMPPAFTPVEMTAGVRMQGRDNRAFTQLSPRFSMNWTPRNSTGERLYATIARGYRAGGYNIQLFSDRLQQAIKDVRSDGVQQVEIAPDDIAYKPEFNWSYEIGGRKALLSRGRTSVMLDGALFWADTRNQQVTQMAESGLGRVMRNAARSRSYGVELSSVALLGDFSIDAAWGYTHATFRDYRDGEADYSGNFVPFAPRHTLTAGVRRTFRTRSARCFETVTASARYTGAGRVYFTEDNGKLYGGSDSRQDFYGLLSAEVEFVRGPLSLRLWGRNLTDTRYKTFYFRGITTPLAQPGNPAQVGAAIEIGF